MITALHDTIRVEAHAEGDELVTRLFFGEREIEARPATQQAVLSLLGRNLDENEVRVLSDAGILAPPPDTPVPERLQLHRNVRLEPEPLREHVRTPGVDGPLLVETRPIDLAIDGWVPRHWLAPLQLLLETTRSVIRHASERDFAELFDAMRRDFPAVDDMLELHAGRLHPLLPLQSAQLQYDLLLCFWGDRNPFLSRTRHRFQARVDPTRLEVVGRALAALERGVHGLELKTLLEDDRPGKAMVLGFIGRGMVAEPIAPVEWAVGPHAVGSGSLYEHRSVRLWVDPVYPVGSSRDVEAPRIPVPDVVLFTRSPDPAALFRLPKGIPFVVAVEPGPDALQNRTAALLSAFGCDVHTVAAGESWSHRDLVVEHHGAGVAYRLDGDRTLVARSDGEAPEVDRMISLRPTRDARIGEVLQGVFEPLARWADPVPSVTEATWQAAGRPRWGVLGERDVARSATHSVVSRLERAPVPEQAIVCPRGPLDAALDSAPSR